MPNDPQNPTPSPAPATTSPDFSVVPGHASHGVSVGEIPVEPTPIPAGLQPSPEEQYLSHLTAQDEATKAAKDTLYQNSPEEFKKQHPVEYWVRKGHDAVQQSLVGHATAAVKPEIAAPVKSDISNVAELGTSLYGLPSGTDEPTIKQGIIPEGAPEELDFSGIAGHKKIAEAPLIKAGTENPELQKVVESAGGVFRGSKSGLTEITLPEHMTENMNLSPAMKKHVSVTLPDDEVTPENVQAAMRRKVQEMGGTPPKEPTVAPEHAPNDEVAQSAQRYNMAHGQPEINHAPAELAPQQSRNELADAYDRAKHEPENPRVQRAYDAMKKETLEQFNHAKNDLGITFDFTDKDPYKSAAEMQADVRNNHHLSVFTGGDIPKDHPLSEIESETGQSYNNIFRATHDIYGHSAGGHDFSEAGEESAYNAHNQMYSPEARPAVKTETQGQANWYFNNEQKRNGGAERFADQKATILPENEQSESQFPNIGKPIPNAGSIPEKGQYAAVRTDDGQIFADPNWQGNTHVNFIRQKGIPPERIQDGGWLIDGVYEPTDRSDTAKYAERAKAKAKVVEVEGGDPNLGGGDTSFDFGANVPESKYHPDLQKVVDKYGESDDPYAMHNGSSFITPEGQYVHGSSMTHEGMMAGAGAAQEDKADFINDTGAIRTQARLDRGGRTLHISVPKDGVTPKQIDALKRGVYEAIGKYGNIVMERADVSPETKGSLTTTKEFGNANHLEQMLKDIDAHPGPKPWMEQAAEKAKTGGFSIHPGTGIIPTEGKIAEVMPEKRVTLNHPPSAEDIQNFYKANKDLLDKHPELHIGGYGNELNISAIGKNAEKVAKKLDQKSIYDLGADKEINTGGRGKQKEFPNYSLAERLRDLQGLPAGNKKRFESLSPTVYDNLSPEARRYLKDNNRLQSEVMNAFHSGISTEILNQRILQNLEEKKTGATSVYMKARPYADFLYDSPFRIKPH